MTTQGIAPNLSIWLVLASVPSGRPPAAREATSASMITLPTASTIAIARVTGTALVVKSFLTSARASPSPASNTVPFMPLPP